MTSWFRKWWVAGSTADYDRYMQVVSEMNEALAADLSVGQMEAIVQMWTRMSSTTFAKEIVDAGLSVFTRQVIMELWGYGAPENERLKAKPTV